MNYWLTIHYPPHDIDFETPFYCGVWLQNGKAHVAEKLKRGDLVFKYEAKTGPARKNQLDNGKTIVQTCREGHMGIVALMEITVPVCDLQGIAPATEYEDGSKKWWRYYAEAKCNDVEGFVPLAELNKLLGYLPGNVMRGFGDDHSGLKRIDKAKFDLIYTAFKQRS